MKENLKTERLKEKEPKYLQMETDILDNGKMIYNMEVGFIIV